MGKKSKFSFQLSLSNVICTFLPEQAKIKGKKVNNIPHNRNIPIYIYRACSDITYRQAIAHL